MLLKSIKLLNIRSYLSEEIKFPEGRVLLSGDIGSGKSTILLAAEFAFFGVMKGDLSGESLLRHGKKNGYVELKIELGGKEIVIKRVLKRMAAGVKQDSGYIIRDGIKKEGTATELKAWVLEMLGYPKELVTKSKGLIYRYTVYTPQEAMKHILFEDKEQRLNTLRRVFNIDKYRRIRENSLIYSRELKEKRRELEGFVSDLEERKKQAEKKKAELLKIDDKIKVLEPKVLEGKDSAEKLKIKAGEKEKEVKELQALKKELAVCDAEIRNRVRQNEENKKRIEEMRKQAEDMEKEAGDKIDISDVRKKIEEKENGMKALEESIMNSARKASEYNAVLRQSEEIKQKVAKLDNCPMCMQEVSAEHKQKISANEDEKSKGAKDGVKECAEKEEKSRKELDALKKDIDELRKKEREAMVIAERVKSIEDKKKMALKLEEGLSGIKKEIGQINAKKMGFMEEIGKKPVSEEEYAKARDNYEKALEKYNQLRIEHSSMIKEKEGIAALFGEISKEIEKREDAGKKLKKVGAMQAWLDDFFVNMVSSMEKQVMTNIYHQFSSIFQDWFNMLIEDEMISARLDDSFTPLIVQNGFETGAENLSGGEKTSCALAYRLALNKVINDLITGIRTKDIIILDEPTDGFSSEQLDKVRDVLEELNTKQAIIVSHEQKIESFVDSVIRIQKNEHTSRALGALG